MAALAGQPGDDVLALMKAHGEKNRFRRRAEMVNRWASNLDYTPGGDPTTTRVTPTGPRGSSRTAPATARTPSPTPGPRPDSLRLRTQAATRYATSSGPSTLGLAAEDCGESGAPVRPDEHHCQRPTNINLPVAAEQLAAQRRRIATLIGRAGADFVVGAPTSLRTHRIPLRAGPRPRGRHGQDRAHPEARLPSVADTPTASVTVTNRGITREVGYTMRVNARP